MTRPVQSGANFLTALRCGGHSGVDDDAGAYRRHPLGVVGLVGEEGHHHEGHTCDQRAEHRARPIADGRRSSRAPHSAAGRQAGKGRGVVDPALVGDRCLTCALLRRRRRWAKEAG